jgi:alkylation response protein AidB-like acyl-CoA dehydrogenase
MRAKEFGLNEDHATLRDAAKRFARQELAPGAKERARQNRIPEWMIKKIAELGYTGMTAEEKYGGQGLDMTSVGVVVEEFGKVDIPAAHVVLLPTQICALLESGTEEQRQTWIPSLCRGELIPSLAITEAGCGTDAAAIAMKAVRAGDNYILNGEKAPATRAMQATSLIVWAKTDPAAGVRGVS